MTGEVVTDMFDELMKSVQEMDGIVKGEITSRTIDADKIKTMDDVRLLFKAMDMRVQPHASNYSELEHLFKEDQK